MLALVERLRDVPGQDSVHGAHNYEHDGVSEGDRVRGVHVRRADEQVVLSRGVVVDGTRGRHHHPHCVDQHLTSQQD